VLTEERTLQVTPYYCMKKKQKKTLLSWASA